MHDGAQPLWEYKHYFGRADLLYALRTREVPGSMPADAGSRSGSCHRGQLRWLAGLCLSVSRRWGPEL